MINTRFINNKFPPFIDPGISVQVVRDQARDAFLVYIIGRSKKYITFRLSMENIIKLSNLEVFLLLEVLYRLNRNHEYVNPAVYLSVLVKELAS